MASDNFNTCLRLVGLAEGGWSDRPLSEDPGGPTMKGITLKTYKAWRLSRGEPEPTKADLRAISDEEVEAILRAQYWDPIRGDRLPRGLDYAVFDFAVNSGPARAARELQALVGVKADGIIGAQTLAAAVAAMADDPVALINDYLDARLRFMKSLKNWSANKNGWTRRIAEVRGGALDMLYGVTPTRPSDPTPKADPGQTSPARSPAGAGAIMTGAGTAGTVASEAAKKVEPLAAYSDLALYLFLGLTVIGIALTAYAAIKGARERA